MRSGNIFRSPPDVNAGFKNGLYRRLGGSRMSPPAMRQRGVQMTFSPQFIGMTHLGQNHES
jgi:hypothetical protein